MAETKEQASGAAATTTEEISLIDQIIADNKLGKDTEQRDEARRQIAALVDEAMKGTIRFSKDLEATINARIGEIDRLLSLQLNEILHAPDFQKLEGSWRGLHYLVNNTITSTSLKIKLLNVQKDELRKDLEKSDYDQSQLWKKVYEEEYGTAGGQPFGLLVGDYEFGRTSPEIGMLEKLSQVAAGAHAPFISAASANLFNWENYTELVNRKDLAKGFDTVDYAKWKSFRDSEDSRYLGLCLPHILMREPYDPEKNPIEGFNYKEDVDGKDHGKYLWGNAAYALAQRMTDAFFNYGWCVAIRGAEGGGAVTGLPVHTFPTDDGGVALKCPTEIHISDRNEKQLSDLGFIPLVHYKNTDYAVFFGAQSSNKPAKYDDPSATANARLSSGLQYMMATSRFAHYLKCMMRDKVGSFATRSEVESFLSRWINNYVLGTENAGQEMKARYPLKAARVEVAEVPGRPGSYRAVMFLQPHFQLEELTVDLRLVADLPKPAGG